MGSVAVVEMCMFKGSVALGAIRTSFVLMFRLFIQAGTLLLVARILEPHEFGSFVGMASLAVLLGALSTFGTTLILLGEISKAPLKRNQVLSVAIPTTFLCGCLLFIAYLATAYWLLPDNSQYLRALIAIGVAEIFLQPLFGLMSTEHHALGRVARAQLMQNFPLILRLLIAAIIFFLGLTSAINIYAGGYVFASILALLLGMYYLPQRWPEWNFWRLPQKNEWKNMFGYAAINISRAGPSELDKTLAVKLLPSDLIGVYAAGARVVGAMTLPIAAMVLSALPRLFRESDSCSGISRGLLVWMYAAALGCSLILACLAWMAAPAFELLFGDKYNGICEVIRWLCLAVPGISLRLVAGNILMAAGKPWFRVGFEVMGLFTLIVISIILTPVKGLEGMIFAVIFSEWTMSIVGVILIFYNRKSQLLT